jgi:hypothetical protein
MNIPQTASSPSTHSTAAQGGKQSRTTIRLNGQVLRGVYRVWLFRKLLPVLVGETILLSLLLYGIGHLVFVRRVIENGVNIFFLSPPKIISFLFAAFVHAQGLTQLLAVVILVLIALLIRHITQGMLRLILVRQNYFGQAVLTGGQAKK